MPRQRDGAPTAEVAIQEVLTPPEQLSPELVLVAPPELAEQARLALPDRPWERFLNVAAAEPAAAPRVDLRLPAPVGEAPIPAASFEAPALRPGPAVPALRPSPAPRRPTQGRHRAVPRVAPPRRLPRRRTRFSRLLMPVATVAFALAAVTWASEQTPPLTTVAGPASPSVSPTPRVTIPPRAAVASPRTVVGSGAPKSGSRAVPSKKPATPVRIKPVAHGGYVFPRGRLVVSANRRSLERLELTEFCSQAITISRLPVTARGTFAYSGPALRGRFRVALSGSFVDSRRVRLGIVLHGPGCPTRPVAAVGRLS